MAMTENQCSLIRAVARNDQEDARKYAIACLTEDTSKKNTAFCRRYKDILTGSGPRQMQLPQQVSGLLSTEDVSDFDTSRYWLSTAEEELAEKIIRTQKAAIKLAELHIPYVNATLLHGVPGTGKTLFAKYMAYRFGLPYVYVNFSGLITSYMGDTSRNLAKVFSFAQQEKCVLMLDEIDCIGLQRGAGNEKGVDGELARTTITLMQEMDKLTCNQIVIAATNRADRLDTALLRRFSSIQEVLPPNVEECVAMAEQFLATTGIPYDKQEIEDYAGKGGRTQAEMIRFATDLVIREVTRETEEETK